MRGVLVLFVLCAVGSSDAFFMRLRNGNRTVHQARGNVGEPLFLTPYIDSGRLAEGRRAAVVPPLLDDIPSYSGFLTVNKEHGSNLFFWFFPAEESPETAPLALWLQGGPGAPSEYGLISEIGPFDLLGNHKVGRKKHYWTQKLNYIFLDQPVGTGFSYTEKEEGYVDNMTELGQDVYNALLQFFQLFPEYSNNEFIVTGESYGGKYVPAVAYTIHKSNPTSTQKINLKGVAIGNGWTDPYSMMDYANLLWYLGFIDQKTRVHFAKIENYIKSLIKEKKYVEGFWALDRYLQGDIINGTYFYNITGLGWYYNFINGQYAPLDDDMIHLLNKTSTRRSIHVGNVTFYDLTNQKVQMHLLEDDLQSITPWLEVLMDHYKVLLYNGQLDIICAYPLTMNYVKKLKWKGAKEYAKADRNKWYVGGDLAGYWKTAGNFTELLVRNSGHMVPIDQPVWALDMITNFAFDRPFKRNPH